MVSVAPSLHPSSPPVGWRDSFGNRVESQGLGDPGELVYHSSMAITSTQALGAPFPPPTTRAISVRDTGSLASRIPQLAVPGVAVTIGAAPPAPLIYNPAGLVRALAGLDSADALPAGTSVDTGTAGVQGDLETVLGLNSDTGFLGAPDAIGSLAGLSGDSKRALDSVLAEQTGGSEGNDLILQELLARALNASSSGLDRARSATAVLNATGVLRSGSADASLKALEALQQSNLGLAATAIDAGVAATGSLVNANLLANSSSDSNSLGLNQALKSNLDQATAELDAGRLRRRSAAQAGASDLLLSGVSLLTEATDVLAIDAEPTLLADQLAQATSLPLDALARIAPQTPQRAALPTGETEAEFTALAAAPASAPRQTQNVTAAQEASNARAAGSPQDSPMTEAPAASTSPAAGIASVTREPRYAEIAASMNMGAAVYRFQTSVSTGVPPGDVAPLRTVLQIRSTPAVDKVA